MQETLVARRAAACDPDRPTDLLFDGKLTCSLCGATLQLFDSNKQRPYYVCQGRRHGNDHRMFWIQVELAESRLETAILDSVAAQAASARAASKLRADSDAYEDNLRREARRLGDRLARNESDICLWAGRSSDPEYYADEIENKLAHLASQREQLVKDIERNRRESRLHRSRRAKCETAATIAGEVKKVWHGAGVDERRELVDRLVQSFDCEPTVTGVTVHVGFITGDAVGVRFYTRAKAAQDCGDIWAIGPSLLTTAHYLRQGQSIRQIADLRHICTGTVAAQVSVLRRVTGMQDVSAVVAVLTAVLDARADEMYVDGRKPRRTGRRPRGPAV